MRVSVVAPLRNEASGLSALIDELIGQMREGDELVLVETGSTDGTLDIAESYAAQCENVRLVKAPGAFPGAARNAGVKGSQSEIIAQIDGGNHPERGWLEALRAPIESGEADYVMGEVAPMRTPVSVFGSEIDMGAVLGASFYRGSASGLRSGSPGEPAGGASVAYLRSVWRKAGGFPDWLRSGEDPLYVEKVMLQRPRVAFAPSAVVYWQIGPGLCDAVKRHYRSILGKFRTYRGLRAGAATIASHTLILLSLAAGIFIPAFRVIGPALLVLETSRQIWKTYRTCRSRGKNEVRKSIVLPPVVAAVETAAILARMAAILPGLAGLILGGRRGALKRAEYLRS